MRRSRPCAPSKPVSKSSACPPLSAEKGNLNVISDAGVAVLAANAGLRSAALNVFINAKAIKDRDFAEKQIAEVNALLAQAAEMTESVYQTVRTKIGS